MAVSDTTPDLPRPTVYGDGYAVQRMRHGIAVFGLIPISDMVALSSLWEDELGYDTIDALIGQKIRAVMVIGEREQLSVWRKELGIETEIRGESDTTADSARDERELPRPEVGR